jgi:mannose/cellobiose epimerase-like protein (N-acyl-D-glucosamine 2-epimerase family)
MAITARTPLLSPGHEAEWAQINREEDAHRRANTLALSPSERLQVGQRLSQQAVSLLAASIRAGHVPRRALWS